MHLRLVHCPTQLSIVVVRICEGHPKFSEIILVDQIMHTLREVYRYQIG